MKLVVMMKGGALAEGSVRDWKGKKYQKKGGQWLPVGRKQKKKEKSKPVIRMLSGDKKNALTVIGKVSRVLRDAGQKEESKKFYKEAIESKDYASLMQTASKYVEIK